MHKRTQQRTCHTAMMEPWGPWQQEYMSWNAREGRNDASFIELTYQDGGMPLVHLAPEVGIVAPRPPEIVLQQSVLERVTSWASRGFQGCSHSTGLRARWVQPQLYELKWK
jgi:hypothetical protein